MSTIDEKSSMLDAVLINALVNSTQSVLSTMANTTATVKEVKAQRDYTSEGDISAVIGIMGDGGEGMLALCFPVTLANLIVSRLLGVGVEAVSSNDRCDGIGELVNMISGNAKTILSKESGGTYKLSLPSIILGHGHMIQARPKNSPYILIVFEIEGQVFQLQVTFKFN